MLVAKKENVNFNLPPEISDEFSDLVSELGGKQKWAAVTAAILMLVESKPLMRYYVQRVVAAEVDHSFASLLQVAKNGELRKQAESHLAPPMDDINVLLHPDNPQNVLTKTRRKRTG